MLLVRSYFLERAANDLAFQGVNNTRAALCELLATKLLSLFDPHLSLPTILTTRFNAFAGVQAVSFESESQPTQEEIDELVKDGADTASSAIEVAIDSGAKRFIRCPAIQCFLDDLYSGNLLYKPSSQHALMKDTYKSGTVDFFEISSRPLLDHNVLRVPRIRRYIEFGTILVLVTLFLVVQYTRDVTKIGALELVFILYTCGYALEELANIRESGIKTYLQQLWNVLDSAYLGIARSSVS